MAEEHNGSFDPQTDESPNEPIQIDSNQTGSLSTAPDPDPGHSSRSSRVIAEVYPSSDHSYHSNSSSASSVTLVDDQSLQGSVRPANLLQSKAGTSLQSDTVPILLQSGSKSLQSQVRTNINELPGFGTEPDMNPLVNTDLGLVTTGHDKPQSQSGVNTRSLGAAEFSHQPAPAVNTQASFQSLIAGPVREGRPSQGEASGSSRHWQFPNRKRSPSSHVAPENSELILSVTFDQSPGDELEPMHRGHQQTSVPTVLANRSVRGAKSAHSTKTKK